MKSLKVGDYVRIRKDLTNDECGINEITLSEYKGKITKITASNSTTFKVDIDNGSYIWDKDWFEDEDIEIDSKSQKSHYEVGDYVRIRNDIQQMIDDEVDVHVGIVTELTEYAGKLARITKAEEDSKDTYSYKLDVDDGEWWWCDELFQYRLGNYEDNDIENHHFKYEIGYHRYENRLEIFEGFIENFYPSGKSAFVDENGKLLVLPYDRIEFIIPKESDND